MTPWDLVLLLHLEKPIIASMVLAGLIGYSLGIVVTLVILKMESHGR